MIARPAVFVTATKPASDHCTSKAFFSHQGGTFAPMQALHPRGPGSAGPVHSRRLSPDQVRRAIRELPPLAIELLCN